MALTQTTMVDDPNVLMIASVDYGKADGAIASVEVTNRGSARPVIAWAIYNGRLVESPPIALGDTFTQTFRGASARAGDVSELGYRV